MILKVRCISESDAFKSPQEVILTFGFKENGLFLFENDDDYQNTLRKLDVMVQEDRKYRILSRYLRNSAYMVTVPPMENGYLKIELPLIIEHRLVDATKRFSMEKINLHWEIIPSESI